MNKELLSSKEISDIMHKIEKELKPIIKENRLKTEESIIKSKEIILS